MGEADRHDALFISYGVVVFALSRRLLIFRVGTTVRKADGFEPLEPIDRDSEGSPGGPWSSKWLLVRRSREAVRGSLPTLMGLNRRRLHHRLSAHIRSRP